MPNLRMLLFSSGQSERNKPFYHYCHDWLQDFVTQNLLHKPNIYFISWATWAGQDADAIFNFGQEHWGQFSLTLKPFHKEPDFLSAILNADAIIVSGGSIHMLVRELELNQLMVPLKDKIESGCIYIGTSSGSIITGPTMHTCTEPPLVNIPSHKTLNILPFQLTCHYYEVDKEDFHNGPTPAARIKNYLQLNPDSKPVVCLRDGSFLDISGQSLTVRGTQPITLFDSQLQKTNFTPNTTLSTHIKSRKHL